MSRETMACLATLADLQSFDRTKLSFGEMKKPEMTNTMSARPSRAQIRYKGEPLRVQTPLMYLPFKYEPDMNNTGLTFCTLCDNAAAADRELHSAFIKVMREIQSFAAESAKNNSQEWFSKSTASFEDSEDIFTMPLREHSESKYPPHLKVKYYRSDDGRPQFPMYDGNNNKLICNRSTPGKVNLTQMFAMNTRHRVIIDCTGIWSLNKRGGITWRINDVLCYGPAQDTFPFANVTAPPDIASAMQTDTQKCAVEDDVYVEAVHLPDDDINDLERTESCVPENEVC